MLRLCWIITAISASLGLVLLVVRVFVLGEASAPQVAAVAAVACGLGVIPYVFTRAIEGLRANPAPPGWHTPGSAAERPRSHAEESSP